MTFPVAVPGLGKGRGKMPPKNFVLHLPPDCPPALSEIKKKKDIFMYKVVRTDDFLRFYPLKNVLPPPPTFDAGTATGHFLLE